MYTHELRELGQRRLGARILGGDGGSGLDIISGLELEARLMLEPGKPPGEKVSEDEIHGYVEKKFRALAQLAGVLARVSSAVARSPGV